MDTDFFYSIDGNIRSEGEIFSDDKDISTQSESTKGEVLLKEDDVPLTEEMSTRDLINRLSPLFEEGNNEIPALEEINKTLETLGIEISDDIFSSRASPRSLLKLHSTEPSAKKVPLKSKVTNINRLLIFLKLVLFTQYYKEDLDSLIKLTYRLNIS